MFRNCNNCCFPRYLNGILVQAYLRVTNYTDLQIYFILQFTSRRGVSTKQSGIFGRGSAERLLFPYTALNIAFNVLNASLPIHPLICNHTLDGPSYYRFNVVETPTGPACVQEHYSIPY